MCYYPSGQVDHIKFLFISCEVLLLAKIIVCGKGGSGKSTVTALLARYLAVNGRSVCAIDADESSFSLHRMINLPSPERTLVEELGGREAIAKGFSSGMSLEKIKDPRFSRGLHVRDLPCTCVSCRDNLYLVSIGKIREPKEGCSCVMTDLARQFISMLYMGNWTYLIDTSSPMEHVARSLYEACDEFLVVLDPTMESLELAVKMRELSVKLNKRIYLILNKVSERTKTHMTDRLKANDLEPAAVIPYFPALEEASMKGEPLPLQKTVIHPLMNLVDVLFDRFQLESAFMTSTIK